MLSKLYILIFSFNKENNCYESKDVDRNPLYLKTDTECTVNCFYNKL